MEVRSVFIGEIPPEMGPSGKRIIVVLENGRYESILIAKPINAWQLADGLRVLADTIERATTKGK